MEGLLSTVLPGSDQVQGGSTSGIAMRGNRKVTCVLLRTFQLVFLCFGSDRAETIAHRGHTEVVAGGWVEKTLKGLSLEEKAGQMLQVRYYADYQSLDSPEYKRLRDQIQKYHIGSVVFGMHFNQEGPLRGLPLDAARVANQLQSDSELPLLLAADLERGVASRLKDAPSFPWPMAWGALYDPSTVGRFGAITAREARSVGIQWDLAPVVDVNSNPANPVINDRSFGEDPEQVSSIIAAYIRGAQENGVLVTAKHFPGHGDSSVDSHRGIPSIDGDLDHLNKFELLPFRKAIEAGVDSIMLAHARVPAIDPDPNKIATISSKIVMGVLREQMRFKGVVLTDALEMKGITTLYDTRKGSPTALAAVDAVRAGCDVIMIPTDLDGAFHAIVDAVRRGEIPQSRIDESVRKVLLMKAKVGLDKQRFVDVEHVTEIVSRPEDIAFAQEVADKAVTLVRENGKLLPLMRPRSLVSKQESPKAKPAPKRRLIGVVLAEDLETSNGHEFEKELLVRRPDAHIFYVDRRTASAGGIQVLESIKEADEVVIAAYVVHGGARQTVVDGETVTSYGLRGPSGELLKKILAEASGKTVVVALGSPYLIANFLEIQNYACTYAMTTTSEISAVKALFGEIQNHAKLPVTLPGIAPRGFSLPWPTQSLSLGNTEMVQ
jgi:beta-N-acetylhexosaminidase